MQQHVHAADTEHRAVEVVAVEGVVVEAAAGGGVLIDGVAVVFDQILRGGDEVARCAAGRIADHIFRGGRTHVHHQLDDVARGAELPVLPGRSDLAEHVFVEVTLGVAVGHVDVVELINDVRQQVGRGHHEEGVLHVVGVGRTTLAIGSPPMPECLHEGEHVVAHRLKHLLWRNFLEARPAKLVLAGREHRLVDGLLGAGGLVLLERVQLVEALDEEQVGELFDDGKRVRDAPGPHRVPNLVHLGLEFTRDHGCSSPVFIESSNDTMIQPSDRRRGSIRFFRVSASDSCPGIRPQTWLDLIIGDVRRLTVLVEFPVFLRILVGRVPDRLLKEVGHRTSGVR